MADLDFDAAFESSAEELDLDTSDQDDVSTEPIVEAATEPVVTNEPDDIPMPQSWKKEWENDWKATPKTSRQRFMEREKQMLDGLEQYKGDAGFGRSLREVFNPYSDFLKNQGVDEAKAAQYLLNAHYRLTNGSAEDKAAYWAQLAQSYGIQTAQADPNAPAPAALPAEVQAALRDVQALKGTIAQQQQREFEQRKATTAAEVNAFADDPKNAYFDECADHVAQLVKAGYGLKEAYETAVYANPVTRAKELQRLQTEAAASLKEKAKQTAKAARKASSVNVNPTSTKRAPTEPAGTMDDTLRETMSEIRARAH